MAEILEIALEITGAARAVGHVMQLASAVNETATAFTNMNLAAGNVVGASSRAAALGAGIGLNAGQTGSLAGSIRDAIAAGGLARGAASQLGVGGVLPRGLGGPNDAQVMATLADGIRRVRSEQEAYNLALKIGAPELLRFRLLGDEQIRNIRRLGDEIKKTFSPEAQARLARAQADFEIAQQRVLLGLFRIFDDLILKPRYGQDNELHQALQRLGNATTANTNATVNNTVAINRARSFFGGGERARGAFPAGLRGELLRSQLRGDKIKLGGIPL